MVRPRICRSVSRFVAVAVDERDTDDCFDAPPLVVGRIRFCATRTRFSFGKPKRNVPPDGESERACASCPSVAAINAKCFLFAARRAGKITDLPFAPTKRLNDISCRLRSANISLRRYYFSARDKSHCAAVACKRRHRALLPERARRAGAKVAIKARSQLHLNGVSSRRRLATAAESKRSAVNQSVKFSTSICSLRPFPVSIRFTFAFACLCAFGCARLHPNPFNSDGGAAKARLLRETNHRLTHSASRHSTGDCSRLSYT